MPEIPYREIIANFEPTGANSEFNQRVSKIVKQRPVTNEEIREQKIAMIMTNLPEDTPITRERAEQIVDRGF